jgi:hypothetical protein
MIRFTSEDLSEYLQLLLGRLRRCRGQHGFADGVPHGRKDFAEAAIGLVGLRALAGRQADAAQTLTTHKNDIAALLVANEALLRDYVDQLDTAMWAPTDNWGDACMHRSAVQILLDDIADDKVRALIDIETINNVDMIMRRSAGEVPPLAAEFIPVGLPDDHWWWRLPRGEPPDDELWW